MSSGKSEMAFGSAQDDKEMAQRGAHGARMASTVRALATWKVIVDELGHQLAAAFRLPRWPAADHQRTDHEQTHGG